MKIDMFQRGLRRIEGKSSISLQRVFVLRCFFESRQGFGSIFAHLLEKSQNFIKTYQKQIKSTELFPCSSLNLGKFTLLLLLAPLSQEQQRGSFSTSLKTGIPKSR